MGGKKVNQAGKILVSLSSQLLFYLIRKLSQILSYSVIYLDTSKLNASVAIGKTYLLVSCLFCVGYVADKSDLSSHLPTICI